MKKLIIMLMLLIMGIGNAQKKEDNNLLLLGLWASIDGNLLESGLNRLADVNNLGLKVPSGQFTLTQTGAVIQNRFDGTWALDAFSIDNGIDDKQPTFSIVGDADSDAGGDVSETLQITLTPNATPTSATWDFTTTQALKFNFDLPIFITSNTQALLFANRSSSGKASIQVGNSEGSWLLSADGGIGIIESVDNGLEIEAKTTINQTGSDLDFRVESDNQDSALVVDGGTGIVHIEGELVVDGGVNYKVDTASDDDYLIAITSLGAEAIVEGTVVTFTAQTLNTGACTLTINGGVTISIKTQAGGDPVNSYIVANSFVMLGHNGTNWILLTMDSNQ